jgi:hypothetical protein
MRQRLFFARCRRRNRTKRAVCRGENKQKRLAGELHIVMASDGEVGKDKRSKKRVYSQIMLLVIWVLGTHRGPRLRKAEGTKI